MVHHGNIFIMLEYFEYYTKYTMLFDVAETNNAKISTSSLDLINMSSWQ